MATCAQHDQIATADAALERVLAQLVAAKDETALLVDQKSQGKSMAEKRFHFTFCPRTKTGRSEQYAHAQREIFRLYGVAPELDLGHCIMLNEWQKAGMRIYAGARYEWTAETAKHLIDVDEGKLSEDDRRWVRRLRESLCIWACDPKDFKLWEEVEHMIIMAQNLPMIRMWVGQYNVEAAYDENWPNPVCKIGDSIIGYAINHDLIDFAVKMLPFTSEPMSRAWPRHASVDLEKLHAVLAKDDQNARKLFDYYFASSDTACPIKVKWEHEYHPVLHVYWYDKNKEPLRYITAQKLANLTEVNDSNKGAFDPHVEGHGYAGEGRDRKDLKCQATIHKVYLRLKGTKGKSLATLDLTESKDLTVVFTPDGLLWGPKTAVSSEAWKQATQKQAIDLSEHGAVCVTGNFSQMFFMYNHPPNSN